MATARRNLPDLRLGAAIRLACGVLDEREALARIVGDAAGHGRISDTAARKAGDKAGRRQA